jgi:serine acetyltransferase
MSSCRARAKAGIATRLTAVGGNTRQTGNRQTDPDRRQRLARPGGVIVCPGVTIGDNSVIGAGPVVTRDLPANVVAVGNPARVLREI